MILNSLSLCSGIGAMDLGLERTGQIRTVGQVEIDPWCRDVLAEHWPAVPRHDDIKTAAEWWGSEQRPGVDLVGGGAPCQPFSVAGRKLGVDAPRHLWPWARDIIEVTRPAFVLLENVPRIQRVCLDLILRDLAGLGFDAWWDRIPAAALGAPHLRWRFFLIAAHPGRCQLRHEPWGSGGEDWPRSAVTGYDGAAWAVVWWRD